MIDDSKPALTLYYFALPALAEPIRLAAAIGKIPFKNHTVQLRDWIDFKHQTPLGQLPFLEISLDNGMVVEQIPESIAILRYVGKLAGLYPNDPLTALKVDSLVDTAAIDTVKAIEASSMGGGKFATCAERNLPQEVRNFRSKMIQQKSRGLTHYLEYFEKTLKKNGTGWLVGKSVTIADLVLFRVVTEGIPRNVVASSAFPGLLAHRKRVQEIPEVQQWYKEYSSPYKTFAFLPNAAANDEEAESPVVEISEEEEDVTTIPTTRVAAERAVLVD